MEKQKQKLPSFAAIQEEIQNILDVFDNIENDRDEYSMELNDAQRVELDIYLEELGTQEAQKVDGFAQFLRMSEAQQQALKAEADRLLKRAKTLENTRNYLKMRYLQVMEQYGLKKVSGQTYTISRRCTKCVQIISEQDIPEEFCCEKTIVAPVKQKIMAALKEGKEVPGCQLSETVSLQVK